MNAYWHNGNSANRIPERFSPGTFDYFGASHQIFHGFVVDEGAEAELRGDDVIAGNLYSLHQLIRPDASILPDPMPVFPVELGLATLALVLVLVLALALDSDFVRLRRVDLETDRDRLLRNDDEASLDHSERSASSCAPALSTPSSVSGGSDGSYNRN